MAGPDDTTNQEQREQQQQQGAMTSGGGNPQTVTTTVGEGPPTIAAGGTPPPHQRPPPPAGSPAAGAQLVNTAVKNAMLPMQQHMSEQTAMLTKQQEVLVSLGKVLAANPAATVLSPPQIPAASVAPTKSKKTKDKKKKRREDSSSSSSTDSDEDDSEFIDRLTRLVDKIDALQPSDPSGYRKQVFSGFEAQARLALALLAGDQPDVKGATKVLKSLVRRTEVGKACTDLLASEPRIGLSAADICFSSICNEEMYRGKTKPTKIVECEKGAAIKRASNRSGGGMGGGAAGGDGAGGFRGGAGRGGAGQHDRRREDDYGRFGRDGRDGRDNKRRG
ncbi:hypothetical protein PLESTM_002077200 [Pleodorina starrii]|nr:hypothetical protein PLESTM_002077200 [Pleodorina starrii]